jgi:hypothetical protein
VAEELDVLREAIKDRLSWTPYPAVERHRNEVLDAAVGVAAELLWLHAEAVWLGQDVEDSLRRAVRSAHQRIDELVAEKQSERSSRQAWAEEAMREDQIAEKMLAAVARYDSRLRFVAARYLSDGSGLNFRGGRCTGVSSDALAWFAVERRDEPKPHEYPLDPSDLAACERTYEMAPEFLQERMAPVLARYRAAVAKSYPEVSSSVLPDGGPQ